MDNSKEETHDKSTEGTSYEFHWRSSSDAEVRTVLPDHDHAKDHKTTYRTEDSVPHGRNHGLRHCPRSASVRATTRSGAQGRYYPGSPVKLRDWTGSEQFIYGFDNQLSEDARRTIRTRATSACPQRHQPHPGPNDALHVEVSGTKQESLESNADYHVEAAWKPIAWSLAGLPVEDADKLAA